MRSFSFCRCSLFLFRLPTCSLQPGVRTPASPKDINLVELGQMATSSTAATTSTSKREGTEKLQNLEVGSSRKRNENEEVTPSAKVSTSGIARSNLPRSSPEPIPGSKQSQPIRQNRSHAKKVYVIPARGYRAGSPGLSVDSTPIPSSSQHGSLPAPNFLRNPPSYTFSSSSDSSAQHLSVSILQHHQHRYLSPSYFLKDGYP